MEKTVIGQPQQQTRSEELLPQQQQQQEQQQQEVAAATQQHCHTNNKNNNSNSNMRDTSSVEAQLVNAMNGTIDVTPQCVASQAFSGFEGPEKKLEIDFKRRCTSSGAVQYAAFPIRRSTSQCGLRALSRAKLDTLCALVSCTILSSTSNDYFDSYVLSESSLFVYPQKLLMKTCGTTTLLRCLALAIEYAAEVGLEVEALFYSRQKFIFPEKQKFPHTSFEAEVAHLSGLFPGGTSHCLGDQSSDHWFLYHVDLSHGKSALERQDRNIEVMMEKLDADIMALFQQSSYADVPTAAAAIAAADPALLVRRAVAPSRAAAAAAAGMDEGVVAAITRIAAANGVVNMTTVDTVNNNNGGNSGNNGKRSGDDVLSSSASPLVVVVTESKDGAGVDDRWRDGVPAEIADAIERGDKAGAARLAIRRLLPLHELFPGLVVDDHVFDPCGYSVNGLCGPHFVTMHVTPELSHSFVSFETNCSFLDAPTVMSFVATRLRPGRAALSILADAGAAPALALRRAAPLALPTYRARARAHYELYADDGSMPYDVVYSTFVRATSSPCAV